MKLFINATGNISPQKTFGHPPLLQELIAHTGNRLRCLEPDYTSYIDVKLIRRMSRIIKMGVAAALDCLKEAGVKEPDAIVTGTAFGCLEDTGVFLKKMVEQKEALLTPTAFIQSTHNTIGAQIALLLQCHKYNNTFVHRGFSFESALLDAMLLIEEGLANNVLVGSIDEITDFSHSIISRFGRYKKESASNLELFSQPSKGTIAGEGASFFLLSKEKAENSYANLNALHTFYKPVNIAEIEEEIVAFLKDQSLSVKDLDLVLLGKNGDPGNDAIFDDLNQSVFKESQTCTFKHLCGDYPTSSGFALWLAASIIKAGSLPSALGADNGKRIHRILVYNQFQGIHHSLLLASSC